MKKYEITKEQVLELSNESSFTKATLNKWFPEIFETKLEVGKWYKDIGKSMFLYFVLEIKDSNNINAYGFNADGEYTESIGSYEWGTPNFFIEATEQEVKTALENEAVKRGFVDGIYYIHKGVGKLRQMFGKSFIYYREDNSFRINGFDIFDNGKWATIIPTLTKKEAEEKLNCKII